MKPNKTYNKKHITLEDFRNDREYWKNRSIKQQSIIDVMLTKRQKSDTAYAKEKALRIELQEKLQATCMHMPEHIESTEIVDGQEFSKCGYCDKRLLSRDISPEIEFPTGKIPDWLSEPVDILPDEDLPF